MGDKVAASYIYINFSQIKTCSIYAKCLSSRSSGSFVTAELSCTSILVFFAAPELGASVWGFPEVIEVAVILAVE
jgi:hypothetical protein